MRQLISAVKRRLFRPSETIEGYEQPELIDVIFRKTVAYQPDKTLDIGAARSVLDFGGGCGLHYKEAGSPAVRWAVVETAAMVEKASQLSTQRLRFFTNINDATAWLGTIDLMHSNGALQCTPNPEQALLALCGLGAKKMNWSRLFLSNEPKQEIQSSFLGDNGPGSISVREKTVLYERKAISEAAFLSAHSQHQLIERGSDWFRFKFK